MAEEIVIKSVLISVHNGDYIYTLRLVLLAGTNFSVLVVCCIWQVFILVFLRELVCFSHLLKVKSNGEQILAGT